MKQAQSNKPDFTILNRKAETVSYYIEGAKNRAQRAEELANGAELNDREAYDRLLNDIETLEDKLGIDDSKQNIISRPPVYSGTTASNAWTKPTLKLTENGNYSN